MESIGLFSAATDNRDSDGLRQLDWAELAARFAVARELRQSLSDNSVSQAGSFFRLAGAEKRPQNAPTSYAAINLSDLATGKADVANSGSLPE